MKKLGMENLSRVILDYADELIKGSSPEEMERTIFFAIAAWNLSLVYENTRLKEIDGFLYDVMKLTKNSDEWKETLATVEFLIEKRLFEYPDENRCIVDYDFIQTDKKNFSLNVVYALC